MRNTQRKFVLITGIENSAVAPAFPQDTASKHDQVNILPEFGRWQDVQRIFGIKRGILYRKIADGTIQSISLREPGKKYGCRLVFLPSVRAWLNSLMEEQSK
jgi:hypothetical protein